MRLDADPYRLRPRCFARVERLVGARDELRRLTVSAVHIGRYSGAKGNDVCRGRALVGNCKRDHFVPSHFDHFQRAGVWCVRQQESEFLAPRVASGEVRAALATAGKRYSDLPQKHSSPARWP